MSISKQRADIARRKNQEVLTARAAQDYSNLSGVSIFGTPDQVGGELAARKTADLYYGGPRQIAEDAANYRGLVKSNIGKPSALANRLTQVSNQELSRAGAQTAGADSPAARIKARRESISKSNEMQQAEDRANMANYGKSIGAGISGTESLAAAGAGRGTAATPTPTPNYGGGMFGSIICTELYNQKKLTIKELIGCRDFGASLTDFEYYGYLVIARPIVKLMKRSTRFSNVFISWAKAISTGNPNNFTKFMIPVCGIIGKISLEVKYGRHEAS